MEMTYGAPRMRGAESTFQQWSITPLSSNQYWLPNDVVKFMGNISTGLVDFYRTHLQFQIVVQQESMPVGGVQIDNSAQSLISQTVILSEQRQVERIQDYDTLAAGLSDIGFSQILCQNRTGQGIGFTNIGSNLPATNAATKLGQITLDVPWDLATSTQPGYAIQNSTQATFSPVITPQYTGSGYQANVSYNQVGSPWAYTNQVSSNLAGGSVQSLTNWITFPLVLPQADDYTLGAGRAMAVRSQYNLLPQTSGYPDIPSSFSVTAPQIKNQNWSYTTMSTKGYSASSPYVPVYGKTPPTNQPFTSITPATCGVNGYTKPYAPQFAVGCNEPLLSPTIPQVQMMNGVILPSPIPLARKTFRIPLISAILGILIPPDQFKLIPAATLKNLILQLSLNPYAFFTTGYSDVHQLDQTGMQIVNMQKRQWKINSFQWVWHLYTFQSAQLSASIQQEVARGITISSNYWQLQAQYQLPNGSYVRNTFQIPANVQSLAQVWCLFLSNQYTTKTFCRKQFRLSNCITSLQLKANGNYYPLQPILGNAGNPQYGNFGDNWNFYECLLLSNNYLFNTNVPAPRINQKNFAINSRPYDSDNRGTYMDKTLYKPLIKTYKDAYGTLNGMASNTAMINADTALGQSWFHQNRYVGRAIFSYSFQPYGHSRTFINGLDTRGYRQFDVTFNASPEGVFPKDQTLYIFSRSNVVVKYTSAGIIVLGI